MCRWAAQTLLELDNWRQCSTLNFEGTSVAISRSGLLQGPMPMDVDRVQDAKGKGNKGKNDYQRGKGKDAKGKGKKGKEQQK